MSAQMPTSSIGTSFEIFERLKSATERVHIQIEQRLRIFDPEFDLAGYIGILERFYGFWAPVEAKLLLVKELMHPALGLQTRMKSKLLEADLRILGSMATKAPYCLDLPAIDTFLSGLGCLYVLEGSTLGARIISRRIESHLQLRTDSGAAFFNGYGEAAGRRWSEFRLFVTANVSLLQSEETVNAAVQTFESLSAWVEEPPVMVVR
jgi:heme oxygenase